MALAAAFLTAVVVRFCSSFLASLADNLAVSWVVMGALDGVPVRRVGFLYFVMVAGGWEKLFVLTICCMLEVEMWLSLKVFSVMESTGDSCDF